MGESEYPGWTHLEAELTEAANAGDEIKLTLPEILTVLGEMRRRRDRLTWATALLMRVERGDDCYGSQQGYSACELRGVGLFLAGAPQRRRWWRLGR